MAALSFTAANVIKSTNGKQNSGIAGEAITQGQAVYKKAADKEIYLADCNVDADTAAVIGVALNSADDGQPIDYAINDDALDFGAATIAIGEPYFVGATPGQIVQLADLLSTNFASFVGVGVSTSALALKPFATGGQRA